MFRDRNPLKSCILLLLKNLKKKLKITYQKYTKFFDVENE